MATSATARAERGANLEVVEADFDFLAGGRGIQADELDDLVDEQSDLTPKSGVCRSLVGHGLPILPTALQTPLRTIGSTSAILSRR